jgi:hypothetical protein
MHSNKKEFIVYYEPWPHIMKDDFLSISDLDLMTRLTTKFPGKKKIITNQAFVSKLNGTCIQSSEIFSNEEVLNIFNAYEPSLLEQLKYLAPQKVKYYDY